MKRLALLAALLLSGGAYAQPPQEIVATDTIDLTVGQARTFTFEGPVSKFVMSDEDTARVMPQTDRSFTIHALKPGEVLMIAYAEDGHVSHRVNVSVSDTGHLVRIYGHRKVQDYIGYSCNEVWCGRADPDVEPLPFSTSISETKQKGDGNSTTMTREYR